MAEMRLRLVLLSLGLAYLLPEYDELVGKTGDLYVIFHFYILQP